MEWQFSCKKCAEVTVLTSSENLNMKAELCSAHTELHKFLNAPASLPPVFIGLSSIGRTTKQLLNNPGNEFLVGLCYHEIPTRFRRLFPFSDEFPTKKTQFPMTISTKPRNEKPLINHIQTISWTSNNHGFGTNSHKHDVT
ncbi:UDP-glucuronosyl/UDP-glucosyltransferase [Artemisia annua]|uniref:UDP-glucuronosyl/UDP-glucosyltransferase n=1 Tax=Artemisia annua TaxID=35608 RepID=A0A2U1MR06_ARTAN|nr:UDP-glucuronosyl/UDP-glucosyltransferase [Artemisia annua]